MYYFAYDDIESIEYFGKHLRSYWNRDGQSILDAISEAADEYEQLKKQCDGFSKKLYDDAFAAGGEEYAELLSLLTVRLLPLTSLCSMKTVIYFIFQRNATPTAVPQRLTFLIPQRRCSCFITPSLSRV